MNIHALIVEGIAEDVKSKFPQLELKVEGDKEGVFKEFSEEGEFGDARLIASHNHTRIFILSLDKDGIVLQDSQAKEKAGHFALGQFKDFEYADPNFFDQIIQEITAMLN